MTFSVTKNMDVNEKNIQEEFEDTKRATRIHKSKTKPNTIAKRKRKNGQTTIHKTYP
jgi:hypothetical protein